MSAGPDEITNLEIAMAEYLGTPEGAALAFEVGQEVAAKCWLAGYETGINHTYMEQLQRIEQEIDALTT